MKFIKSFVNRLFKSNTEDNNTLNKNVILDSIGLLLDSEMVSAKKNNDEFLIEKLNFKFKVFMLELKLLNHGYDRFIWKSKFNDYLRSNDNHFIRINMINEKDLELELPEDLAYELEKIYDLYIFDEIVIMENDLSVFGYMTDHNNVSDKVYFICSGNGDSFNSIYEQITRRKLDENR